MQALAGKEAAFKYKILIEILIISEIRWDQIKTIKKTYCPVSASQTLLPRVGITDTIAPCRHPELNEARYESRDVDSAGWSHAAARRRCNPRF